MRTNSKLFLVLAMIVALNARGDDIERKSLEVTDSVWSSLNQAQRDDVGNQYIIEVVASGNFARIVYVQGLDESTPGTTAGAAAGSALAQARYIDKVNVYHYSATKQVGVGIIGAVLGSLLDAPGRQQVRHVYTLKDSTGSISTVEKVTDSAIVVPPGLCVNLGTFSPVNDNLCDNLLPAEVASLVSMSDARLGPDVGTTRVTTSPATRLKTAEETSPGEGLQTDVLVTCRFGNTSNIQTTAFKCKSAGGIQKQ